MYAAHQGEIFPYRKPRCDSGFLWGDADDLLDPLRLGQNAVSAKARVSAIRFQETGEHFDRCRFPGAVYTEQGIELSLCDRQTKSIYGGDIFISFRQIGCNDCFHIL